MRSKGLLFGLNYKHCKKSHLNGCINDVRNMSDYLKDEYAMPLDIFTDDTDIENTSKIGIITNLYRLACETYMNNLEFVYIHYSGHGSSMQDVSGDEKDGKDEALVPSDYETNGLLVDDLIQKAFQCFNPKTRVVCVFDCCHSGTIGDIKYKWLSKTQTSLENINCNVKARLITISGCMDTQTSADAFINNQSQGALTGSILQLLKENPNLKKNILEFLERLRDKLRSSRFSQIPQLCSTYNVSKDMIFLPEQSIITPTSVFTPLPSPMPSPRYKYNTQQVPYSQYSQYGAYV